LKNLSHVAFGRMDKRYEENQNRTLVDTIEKATGVKLSADQRKLIVKGPDELELVNSGLEESMVRSYHEIREIKLMNKKIDSLRTAAFVGAIDKIAVSYMNLGIFPWSINQYIKKSPEIFQDFFFDK